MAMTGPTMDLYSSNQAGNATTTYGLFPPEVTLLPDLWQNASCCSSAVAGNNGSNSSAPPGMIMMAVNPMNLNESMNDFTVPGYGYVSPLLAVITVITNLMVSVVLLKRHMISPTNVMLVAMALSDMFTGVWPVPCFIYFFACGYYVEYVPLNWCFTYDLMVDVIPTIFHTASIWLTMALAVQRYIYVCHAFKARQWCTIPNVLKIIFVIYVLSTVSHTGRFFDSYYVPVEVPSVLRPGQNLTGCYREYRPFIVHNMNLYFNAYFWFRVVFIHLLPCTCLVLLNFLLVRAMRKAQHRRRQLLQQNRRSESRKLQESNCTTLMLVAVVGVFLLVELPSAAFFITYIVQNTYDLNVIDPTSFHMTSLFLNLFILLSYPINFFIYCGMSRQFRETFKRLFIPGAKPLDREHSQYMSLATDHEARTTVATHATNNKDATNAKEASHATENGGKNCNNAEETGV